MPLAAFGMHARSSDMYSGFAAAVVDLLIEECGEDAVEWSSKLHVMQKMQHSHVYADFLRTGLTREQFVQFIHRLRRRELNGEHKSGTSQVAIQFPFTVPKGLATEVAFTVPKGWGVLASSPADRNKKHRRIAHRFSGLIDSCRERVIAASPTSWARQGSTCMYMCAQVYVYYITHLYMNKNMRKYIHIYMQYIHVYTYVYICIRCNSTPATLKSCVDLGFKRKRDSTPATRRNAYCVDIFGYLLRRPMSRDRTSETSDRMSRPMWPDRTSSSRKCLEISASRGQMVI